MVAVELASTLLLGDVAFQRTQVAVESRLDQRTTAAPDEQRDQGEKRPVPHDTLIAH
jgi:hypothetical protein